MENTKGLLKKVTVYGFSNSKEAYVIRDFLKRSVVTYEWVPVDSSASFTKFSPEGSNVKFPVVELPQGKLLFNPGIEEIACNLGWVSKPALKEYDVSIFGGGPAGLSAAVYAASEGLKTVLIEKEAVGGQAGTSSLIENYLGFPGGITGADLAERARQQAVKFGVEILLLRKGIHTEFIDHKIHVKLTDESSIVAKANICATGVAYRRLDVPDEDKWLNAGIYYGAGSSEANLCADKHVFVVGGGNSAGQAALNFSREAKKVTMVIRANNLADSLSYYLLDRIMKKDNIEVLFNSRITALQGTERLEAITIADSLSGTSEQYETTFVFVCIGGSPNTDWALGTGIIRDQLGYLVTGQDLYKAGLPEVWTEKRLPGWLETSVPGCFAAGDVRHNSVKRVASAVGEGAMAVTLIHQYLHQKH
jgi:thioredoxin reductase (NADPH)